VLNLITDHLLGLKLPQGSEPNKLAEELIKALDEEKRKRTMEQFLADTQNDCRKRKRYFDSVAVFKSLEKARLFHANQASLNVLVQRELEARFLAEGKDSALRAGIFKASGSIGPMCFFFFSGRH